MAQQIIETGTQPNDGLGDSVRTAGTKIKTLQRRIKRKCACQFDTQNEIQ